jgi:hypothetical protein
MNGDVPVARKLGDDFGNLGFCQAAFGVFAKQAHGIAYRKYRPAFFRRRIDNEEHLIDNFMPFGGLDIHPLPRVPIIIRASDAPHLGLGRGGLFAELGGPTPTGEGSSWAY